MIYHFLALDLDGTLTNSQKQITPRTKTALISAINRGTIIVLSSGRPLIGIQKVSNLLELDRYGGYIVACNGGQIIDCRTGDDVFRKTVSAEYIPVICQEAKKRGVTPLTYNETGVVAESDTDSYVLLEGYNNTLPIIKVTHLAAQITWPVEKLMVVGKPERIAAAIPELQKKLKGKLNVFLSAPYFIEITARGVRKDAALQRLLEHLNADRSGLMAVGDGLNDISMLQYAGFSVAMGNSPPAVKAAADAVTATNDEDGVALAIEKYILA